MKKTRVIFVKELRSYFDSPIAYVFIVIYLLLSGTYFVGNLFLENVASMRSLFETAPILLLFFAPAITMRLLSEEKRTGTMEILGTKPIRTGEIVVGKFSAAWFLAFCALVPTLFYLATVAYLGNIDLGPAIGGYCGLLLLAGTFVAIGMVGSAASDSQIVAFIVSFVISMVLFVIDKVLIYLPVSIVDFVEYFSINSHFASIARGVLDSRDIVYCFSVIIFTLMLATVLGDVEPIRAIWRMRAFGWKQHIPRVILMTVILVFLNLISMRVFVRIDLTSKKVYTLTPTTKNLIASLDDNFLVRGYFSSNLPPPYNNHREVVQELLDEYRAYSGGKFHYHFINPTGDTDVEEEATSDGITPVQVKVIRNDKYQTEKAYVGLAFTYGDRTERLPAVQSLDNLEFAITASMKKLISAHAKKVAFVQGHGEPVLERMGEFCRALEKNYLVTSVSLSGGRLLPRDVTTLLEVAPRDHITEAEKYNLDQYIMAGGKVAFFVSGVSVDHQTMRARSLDVGLEDMFDNYGWIVEPDLVVDGRCVTLTLRDSLQPNAPAEIPYPFYPICSDFSPGNMIFKNQMPVVLTYTSSIDPRLASIRGVSAEVLMTTSDQSARVQGEDIDVDVRQSFQYQNFTERHVPLAAGIEGEFKSLFAKRRGDEQTRTILKSPTTRLAVVADGIFLLDENLHGQDNVAFGVNVVDWLENDVSLSNIRSRDPSPPPLNEVTERTKRMVKYFDFIIPPTLVVLIGFIRIAMRISRRNRHKHGY